MFLVAAFHHKNLQFIDVVLLSPGFFVLVFPAYHMAKSVLLFWSGEGT